jgi:hypothetical protein
MRIAGTIERIDGDDITIHAIEAMAAIPCI